MVWEWPHQRVAKERALSRIPGAWLGAVGAIIACVAACGWWATHRTTASFVTVPVTRANVDRSIVTTGSVNPLVTVQVGSYVSGPIKSIHCDFNASVEAGEVCAKIDPRIYQQALDQAKANLDTAIAQLHKDEASLTYARINYNRDLGLLETGVASQNDVDLDRSALGQAEALVEVDKATIAQRRAALELAQVNLDYTDIISPVTGVVVSRNVDVGQTVAASFQTPTLFLIAQDLTQMQVDTNVSESDVGAAKVGQQATFTVEAYPDRVFEGEVTQVRRAPIIVQNVVTYDVVIGCKNPDRLLLPGMTADVRIIAERHADVATVPEDALRFDPGSAVDSSRDLAEEAEEVGSGKRRVWVLRDDRPVPIAVEVGLMDGTRAEIKASELVADDRVIVDLRDERGKGAAQRQRSPFGP
jgi:HlyD family secretion protein